MPRAELHRRIRSLIRYHLPVSTDIADSNNDTDDDDDDDADDDGSIRSATRNAIHKAARMFNYSSMTQDSGAIKCHHDNNNNASIDSRYVNHNLHDADAVVVVCGSAFIMAEVRPALSIVEPRDGDVMQGSPGGGSYRDVQVLFVSSSSPSPSSSLSSSSPSSSLSSSSPSSSLSSSSPSSSLS